MSPLVQLSLFAALSEGQYILAVAIDHGSSSIAEALDYISIDASLPVARPLFADLHLLLDEVYATYTHKSDEHLLIPHVGGRWCNLAWHHPRLERLLEVGSAWGLFEWLLRDTVRRGWRLGVCANSDEHRGRCGGGVPGTAVFGTKGGLTGVLAETLGRREVGQTLRARRTFTTTGERLVGLVSAQNGAAWQGDDLKAKLGEAIPFRYQFFGSSGFSSIEAWDATGRIFHRDLQDEASQHAPAEARRKLRIKLGGARLYDRYHEAVWHGSILFEGAKIDHIQPLGGVLDNPEDVSRQLSRNQIVFNTRTSGDFDGVDIVFSEGRMPYFTSVTGHLGGYVKVGNALAGNPHKAQPQFQLLVTAEEIQEAGGKVLEVQGGAERFVSTESILDVPLPTKVTGELIAVADGQADESHKAVYFVAREFNGGKVITSPVIIDYQ